jgi:GalNAc-alpha-(1->4)-GalNAc-alpha-(1->3)-diNAcBac-PP-undecaprenol alpha-1,4-N-acetyl-D-galactosaminyltransferase
MQKKLIFFYPSFERGGATKILISVINYLLKKNIEIYLFSHNALYKDFIKSKKLIIQGSNIKNKSRLYFNLLTTINLLKFLIQNNENNTIFSFQSHLPAIILAKLFRKKIIIRNSEEIFGATKYADKKVHAFITLMLKAVFYNLADIIIAISTKSKQSLEKIIIKKNKVKLIYNPYLINNNKFKKKKNNNNSFNILCVGRLTKQKNFILVIKVINALVKQYPNIILTVVGDGPLKKDLIKSANKNIKFFNWTNNIKKYFLKSDLFILPSYYEGLPNALIEAAYYNIPSISTDCSGAKDILLNNKGGYIIRINNFIELKEKIITVMNKYKDAKKKASYAKKNVSNYSILNCEKYYQLALKEVN